MEDYKMCPNKIHHRLELKSNAGEELTNWNYV